MKKQYVYAIVTILIWATNATVVKAVLFDIPSLQALFISSFFGFFFQFLINTKNGLIKVMKTYSIKEYGQMIGLSFVGLFAYTALYYYGLDHLSAQVACVLNYLWPIMIVLFSCIILKEKMTVMKLVALGCSFLGIVILSIGNVGKTGDNVVAGMLSCFVAAACYGFYVAMNKKYDFNQNIMNMVCWLTVSVSALILGVMTEEWVPVHGMQWLGIIWIGVMVDAIAYLLWALAMQKSDTTAGIANLAYLVPFLSVVISAVFLSEEIQIQAILALVFIVGGILLQYFVEKKYDEENAS